MSAVQGLNLRRHRESGDVSLIRLAAAAGLPVSEIVDTEQSKTVPITTARTYLAALLAATEDRSYRHRIATARWLVWL